MKIIYKIIVSIIFIIFILNNYEKNRVESAQVGIKELDAFVLDQIALSNQNVINKFNDLKASGRDMFSMTYLDYVGAFSSFIGIIPIPGIGEGLSSLTSLFLSALNEEMMFEMVDNFVDSIQEYVLAELQRQNIKTILAPKYEDLRNEMNLFNSHFNDGLYVLSNQTMNSLINNFMISYGYYKYNKEVHNIPFVTLSATSHLTFLNDLATNSVKYKINGTLNELLNKHYNYAINNATELIDEMIRNGYSVVRGQIDKNGLKYHDEYNRMTSYFNWLQIYCTDFMDSWWGLEPGRYPRGVVFENAKLLVSNIVGTMFDSNGNPQNYDGIISMLNEKDVYTYKGALAGVIFSDKTKENPLYPSPGTSIIHYFKYFSCINYVISKGATYSLWSLGDVTDGTYNYLPAMAPQYDLEWWDGSNEDADQDPSVFLFRTKSKWTTHVRDYYDDFDYGYSSQNHNFYKNKGALGFRDKVINQFTPTSYKKVTLTIKLGADIHTDVVQGVVVSFIGNDIIDQNIIIQGMATQVDAQKYCYSSSATKYHPTILKTIVKNFGIGALIFNSSSILSYELNFKSIDDKPRYFDIYVRGSGLFNLVVYQSTGFQSACQTKVGEYIFSRDFSNNNLVASKVALKSTDKNFIHLSNIRGTILLQSLVFVDVTPLEY